MKNKKIILSLLLAIGFIFASFVLAADDTGTQKNQINFIPSMTIPGLYNAGETVPISPSSLAEYIVAIYRYGGMFAGVVAMFMLVYTGWEWLLAGGNSGKISRAKEKINGTLIGLALLFGGYLLLSLISQNLVSFNSLDTEIEKIPCPLYKTENACPTDRCRWVEDDFVTTTVNEAACVDTPVDLTPGSNTCSDLLTETLCTGASLCVWDSGTQTCNNSNVIGCSLTQEQVATNPQGLECCVRMQSSDPSSVIVEFRYAIYAFGQYCKDVCGNGVWQGRDRSVCQSNLGY